MESLSSLTKPAKTLRKTQKFAIIGHNAADTNRKIAPWKNSDVSHLEIDVRQTRDGFLAMHSVVQNVLHYVRLWPFVQPLDTMIDAVITQDKDLYIDYKRGSVEDLVAYLKKRNILDRCTFVIYGRDRADKLKRLAPNNNVYLHIRWKFYRVFDQEPNIYHIGVCLSPKQLTPQAAEYMNRNHAPILATFVNTFEDAMQAVALDISGITTDIPQLATQLEQKLHETKQKSRLARTKPTSQSSPNEALPA